MPKKLGSVEAQWSRPVINDIFEAGGILKRSARTVAKNYVKYYGYDDAATDICNEIKFREFNFIKVDKAINRLANNVPFVLLHDHTGTRRPSASQIANIIASFCAENEIFWDDVNTHRTTVEMDTYRMSTFGKACWDFGCFISQHDDKKPEKRATARTSAGGGGRKATSTTGYKSEGPKSSLIKGLVGKPGEKTTFPSGKELYVITCISSKPKKQYVYIDPIATVSEVNKIKFGDPSGYSTCKVFFSSLDAAKGAIETISAGGYDVPDHVSGFSYASQAADSNGYFVVKTDIGNVYIKASKLNEDIMTEDADAPKHKVERKSKFPAIDNIDVYEEAMHCYE